MLFRVAMRNAWRNPRRSAVTATTVAFGAGALLLFQGFNTGIMTGNRNHTVHAKYGHGQVTTKGYRDRVFESPWDHWIADGDDVRQRLASTPGVVGVFPRIEFYGLLSNGHMNVSGKGVGVDGPSEASFFHALRIVAGEALSDAADGIVLGKGLAKALDVSPGDTVTLIGNTVRGSVNGTDLVVRGVFEIGLREVDDGMFQVQIAAARDLLDTTSVEYFALGLDSHESWDRVAASVTAGLPALEARSFAVLDKIWYQQTVDWLAEQFRIIRLIILSIVLLGIFNSASTAILERTREFGMLRANGESKLDVLVMLLWEGTIVAGAGAVLGIAGVALMSAMFFSAGVSMPPPPGYTEAMTVMIEVTPEVAVIAAFLATTVAVAATAFAGGKVVRMPIASALRAT